MLIDLITPGTMDLIRQIKKNKRLSQVPIVALTAVSYTHLDVYKRQIQNRDEFHFYVSWLLIF